MYIGQSSTSTVTMDQEAIDRRPNAAYCRALYDYKAADTSSLSFRKNDILEVVNRLESGWWDGFLGELRGWFPSNYVAVISDEEIEVLLAQTPLQMQATPSSYGTEAAATTNGIMEEGSPSEDNWLHGDMDQSTSRNGLPEPSTSLDPEAETSDFWLPEVTPDGQIFYVNTHTGQKSRDLPPEAGIIDSELAGLSTSSTTQTGSRSGSKGRLGFRQTDNNVAGFGFPRHTGTPEPWVRKLGDDGMTYYYLNQINGETRWAFPEPEAEVTPTKERSSDQPPPLERPLRKRPGTADTAPTSPKAERSTKRNTTIVPTRQRSGSTASPIRPLPRITTPNRTVEVHSDDSEIYPMNRERSISCSSTEGSVSDDSAYSSHGKESSSPDELESASELESGPELESVTEMSSAERLAQLLQNSLAPPPAELITDLSDTARDAVRELLSNIRLDHIPPLPDEDTMDELIRSVVIPIRNLIYVAAVSPPQIPSHLLPRAARERRHTTASQNMLKGPQRKVTATLAKLVLSARAIQYDSGPDAPNTPSRIKYDAEELDRHIVALVQEVQRCVQLQVHGVTGLKRLRGYFSTSNIGLGLVGAGVAGSWKGLGWVAVEENEESPGRILGNEVVTELDRIVDQAQDEFASFHAALTLPTDDRLAAASRDLIGHLSALLVFVADIHVARHVDIDGIGRELANASDDDLYLQTVNNARILVRTLEATMQSLYDDGSTFLLSTQSMRPGLSSEEDHACHDYLDAIATCMQANLNVVHQTVEALLAVGHDQADMSQGDYSGSIEWRMSRLSVTPTQPERQRPGSSISVVDMAIAFKPPNRKPKSSIISFDESTLRGPDTASMCTTIGPRSETPPGTLSDRDTDSLLLDDNFPQSQSPRRGNKADKIIELLGKEAPRHYIDTVNADSKPWYLRPTYSQTEIVIDPDGSVKGGTVPALVERLTAHEHGDPTFIKTFLMTYKSFTTLDELFDLLVRRFYIPPPDDLKPKEFEEWTKLKQHIIQMRVLNTFKSMVQDDDILEKEDMYILDRMREFLKKDEVYQFAAAKGLLTLIERSSNDTKAKVTLTTASLSTAPPPIQPKSSRQMKLLDIDPLELARQLTIMESRLYQSIKPMECLQRSRETKADYKDNITNVTQNFNRLAVWIQDCVLVKEDAKKRALVIKHFINAADKCRSLHNYSSMVAIISGLNAVPVRRLKRTWELVSARYIALLTTCEAIINPNKNFTNYRHLLAEIFPPCVPYIGVFLTTLTFVQEGSKDTLPDNLVNFRKRQKAAEVIHDIKRWQSQPHNFHPLASVLVFIEESLNAFNDQTDISEKFWNTSLLREPREREDEKMARLLQESGFL